MSYRFKGLTSHEVEASRREHGSNTLVRIKGKGVISRFFENLGDPIIKILVFALALEVIFTFGNCNLVEVCGILVAILIATTVSTLSEYGSEKAFAKIEAEVKHSRVTVIRDGKEELIDADEIVVGDIILVSSGEKVQADGAVLDGELLVDQSALNGENIEARKHKCHSKDPTLSNEGRLYRGSIVVDGSGAMRVDRVGAATFYGRLATDVQSETRVSPLKLRLSKLAGQISVIGYIVAVLVGLTYLFNVFVVDNGFVPWRISEAFLDTKYLFTHLLRALTLMITVVVVAVPEGLPMMITVVLSANMKRMLKDNVLVKKLVGIETAGSLNILFTDKTGTLTTGKLTVDRIITDNATYKNVDVLRQHGGVYEYLVMSAKLNTDCAYTKDGIVGGNSTDRAIAECFADESVYLPDVMAKTPFRSELKYSSVTLKDGRVLVKGAAEIILSRCSFSLLNGSEAYATDLSYVRREYSEAVLRGERVIAVALGNSTSSEALTFIALIVLKDKLRSGVRESVESVMRSGVQIVMLTGDNRDTAVSIAEECGFYRKNAGHIALTSTELARLNDSELEAILPKLRVVARALPDDKVRLVNVSAKSGLVVGMTGDGINDAPSLKLADVGFAMGSGTDIAKSAADIVLLDDSFEAISKTVLYGRTIFKSIRKFITFQLIMNLAACGITLLGPYIGVDTPITIIQMLWVNIIMDTLGGLAFAGEPALSYYMLEKPKCREEPIISRPMLSHVLLNGIYTLALLVFFLTYPAFRTYFGSLTHHLTAFYALFIFSGIVNSFTARSERMFIFSGLLRNKAFMLIMSLITAIQILIVYFGGTLFRSTPLTLRELITVALLSLSVLVFDSIRRVFAKLK